MHVSEMRCALRNCTKVQMLCGSCLRQNTYLHKSIEFVNAHGASTKYVHDVRNSYSRFELLVCRNRNVGRGICCRSDVELWPPGVEPKLFTSLAIIHKQECNRG